MCVTGVGGGVSGPGDRGGLAKGQSQDFTYPTTVITVLLPSVVNDTMIKLSHHPPRNSALIRDCLATFHS